MLDDADAAAAVGHFVRAFWPLMPPPPHLHGRASAALLACIRFRVPSPFDVTGGSDGSDGDGAGAAGQQNENECGCYMEVQQQQLPLCTRLNLSSTVCSNSTLLQLR